MDRLAIVRLESLQVSPHNVLSFTSRQALLELTVVVGKDLPANFLGFVGGFTNLDNDAINRAVVRPPYRSYDQSIGFASGSLSGE